MYSEIYVVKNQLLEIAYDNNVHIFQIITDNYNHFR